MDSSSNDLGAVLLQETPREGGGDIEEPVRKEFRAPPMYFRLLVLACICCLTFGSYWVFDTPGAIPTKLKDYFKEKGESLSNSDLLMFYSIYSWPNTVLALFGGIIIDKITGIRIGALMFCFFICAGTLHLITNSISSFLFYSFL